MKKMVFLDIDGVVADFEGQLIQYLGTDVNRHLYSLEDRYMHDQDLLEVALDFVNDPNSYYALPPLPNGVVLLEAIEGYGFPTGFITSRNGATTNFTKRWVKKYFNNDKIFYGIANKAQYLKDARGGLSFVVDDNPEEIQRLQAIGIHALCFAQPWNAGIFPRVIFDRKHIPYYWASESEQEIPFYEYLEEHYD